jgi:hypothetical protein
MLFPLCIGAALIISALSGEVRSLAAQPGCEVVLQPADADPAWQQAVSELRTHLRDGAAVDVDCRGIEVRADGPRTSLTFTTRDGRRAERQVPGPGALLAIVQALEVTLPEPASEPHPAPDSLPAPPPKNRPADRPLAGARETVPTEETNAHFFIDGSSAVRIAGGGVRARGEAPYAFGSLSLALGVGASVGPWEFGVFGQYDPAQAPWVGPSSLPGLSMSTYAIGIRAGRRERIGPLDAAVGVLTAIAVTDASQNAGMMQASDQAPLGENIKPGVGVFAGVVVPRRGPVRARPEVAFDILPTVISSPTNGAGLPLPWWSTSAAVGVEWETP